DTGSVSPKPQPADPDLTSRVKVALRERPDDALLYAGLYAALADRFAQQRDATTTEAAAIAGRAADLVDVPGVLTAIVDDELTPLLGKPQPITPELAEQASAKLRDLSNACREAAR